MDQKQTLLTAQPLYKRAEQLMIERIVDRKWLPGELLPNEFVLAEQFGVSQGTIRKSLMSLEKRGLLVRSPGRGTMVSRTTPEEALFNFFRIRSDDGSMVVPLTHHETIKRRKATVEEKSMLQPKSDDVYELFRVRKSDERLFVMEKMCFSSTLCEGIEKDLPLPDSLYPYLNQRFGITVMFVKEAIEADVADEIIAENLKIEIGTPVLKVTRRAFDLANRVVEIRQSIYLTNFASYQIDLVRAETGKMQF